MAKKNKDKKKKASRVDDGQKPIGWNWSEVRLQSTLEDTGVNPGYFQNLFVLMPKKNDRLAELRRIVNEVHEGKMTVEEVNEIIPLQTSQQDDADDQVDPELSEIQDAFGQTGEQIAIVRNMASSNRRNIAGLETHIEALEVRVMELEELLADANRHMFLANLIEAATIVADDYPEFAGHLRDKRNELDRAVDGPGFPDPPIAGSHILVDEQEKIFIRVGSMGHWLAKDVDGENQFYVTRPERIEVGEWMAFTITSEHKGKTVRLPISDEKVVRADIPVDYPYDTILVNTATLRLRSPKEN